MMFLHDFLIIRSCFVQAICRCRPFYKTKYQFVIQLLETNESKITVFFCTSTGRT